MGLEKDPVTGLIPGLSARETAIRGQYGQPDMEAQFSAALQPTLQSISPALRGAFFTGARDLFNRFRATQPEQQFLPFAHEQGFW